MSNHAQDGELTPSGAMVLAAQLATEFSAQHSIGQVAFDGNDYRIGFERGRWSWGSPDPTVLGGIIVDVSFDAYGKDRSVLVMRAQEVIAPEVEALSLPVD